VSLKKITAFELALQAFVRDQHQDLLDSINANPVLSDDHVAKMKAVIEAFKKTQV
jgi:F0F1-type ATP synthase alpha subunit